MLHVTTTKDRLQISTRPWVLGIGLSLGILLFAAIALGNAVAGQTADALKLAAVAACFFAAFAVFVRRMAVLFDRSANLITLRTTTVFGQGVTRRPLSDLTSARAEMNPSDSVSRLKSFRPVLVFADGTTLPLTAVYESGPSAQRIAAAINTWLGQETIA